MDAFADPGSAGRAPLVGRARELDRLDVPLRHRAGGTGPVAVEIVGEPGIGKSRLLAEFAARARRQGATVLRGRAGPALPAGPAVLAGPTVLAAPAVIADPGALAGPAGRDASPPFQAFADAFADLDHHERALSPALSALAELVEPPPAAHRGGGDHAAGTPAETGPTAAVGAPDLGAPDDLRTSGGARGAEGGRPGGGEAGRVRRIAAALGRLPADGPVLVLALDDFHAADPASVALVDHLLRHPLRAPVLLVLARRERQTTPALAAVLARAADSGDLARLALGPLTPGDCAQGLVPGLPAGLDREIHAVSLGNPLYHRALAHARTHGGAVPGSGPVAVVLDELAPLDGAQRAVVEALAVLDGSATAELLAAVSRPRLAGPPPAPHHTTEPPPAPHHTTAPPIAAQHAPEPSTAPHPADPPHPSLASHPSHPSHGSHGSRRSGPPNPVTVAVTAAVAVDDVLRELAHRDLVRPRDDGRILVLRHPALPELVRGTLDPWRRRELHRRAAEALAAAGAPVTERAPHLVRAVTVWDPDAAADLVEAAERIGAADPARAAHWLGAVLALLPDTPGHRATWRDLTLRRARALGSAGRVAESRDLLHHLIDSCRAPDTAELRTSAVLLCAFMERHLGRYPEADALLRRELERTPGPRTDLRTWLVVEWGCRALFAARYPEVRSVVGRTLDEARRRRDEAGTAEVLTLAALGEVYEGRTAAARAHAAEAAALTDTFTDGVLAAHPESLVRLGWTEVFLEEYGSAERHATRGIAMARRAGRPFALSQLLLCSAYVHFLTGRVAAALDLAEEALAVARALGGAELVGFSGAIRAVVLLHARPLGDPEPSAAAEEAAATVGTAEGWWATQTRSLLGYAVPLHKDPHRVREVLVRAGGDRSLSRLQPSLRPAYLELLAGAALATGDPAEAERVARLALAEAEPLGLPVQRAAALRAWGQVLARRGASASAARAFTDAARESARSGAVLREAHSLLLAAPQTHAAGDGTRAAAQWRRGRRLAVEGGARMLVDLADRTRPAPPEGATGGRLAVLTPREREIAVLVAEGLTNQAVADRLCLSPRTVESHVARAYRKTGVESRAALASLVVRDGAGDGQFSRG
ncbi:DNA-binding CsgD family transcriptional regulator/tetratricopeptide (TPR) repeat protein [Streptomyces sp. PvR006]|uniref:AAA family ATPase n=1 Tax=Streptomyces sp. PvR006 TaxID=2817860 RepID=UPI0027DCEAFF|nr:AAA family ATPase [Streptomyces sp. PvR006]MBP2580554.1 DNA-binding CsgD family transcriptional regulator/tetratricopeptide (TPR) repeat protein [Streptomyces sp. PvR006]